MTTPALASAWVLMAILYGGGERGASLRDILSAGDYLNHAILTYDELNGALGWLLTAGCVECREGRYFPTSLLMAAYRPIEAASRAAFKRWNALEKFLQTKTADLEIDGPAIALANYNRAVEEYLATF